MLISNLSGWVAGWLVGLTGNITTSAPNCGWGFGLSLATLASFQAWTDLALLSTNPATDQTTSNAEQLNKKNIGYIPGFDEIAPNSSEFIHQRT